MAKRKIVWSHKANIKLFEILEFYNERNKSKEYSKKLYRKFTRELTLLIRYPDVGVKTEIESVRGLVVEGHILFYEITPDKIIVHTLWACRQDPNDLRIK